MSPYLQGLDSAVTADEEARRETVAAQMLISGPLRMSAKMASGHDVEIEVNGIRIEPALSKAKLCVGVGDKPTLVVEIPIIEGFDAVLDRVDVVVPPRTADLLLAAGWLPPRYPLDEQITDQIDTTRRSDLEGFVKSVADALDDWMAAEHGILSSAHHAGSFLARLAANGAAVVPLFSGAPAQE